MLHTTLNAVLHTMLHTTDNFIYDVQLNCGSPCSSGHWSDVLHSASMQNMDARQVPLTLATVKGYTGHQEAGAGVADLMEALNLVSHASVPPALHLRTLNPHVAATLQGRAMGIARGGPAPMGQVSADGLLVTGVSSFGAQGTNAHAIVRGNDSMGSAGRRGEVRLQTARCWVAPAMQVSQPCSPLELKVATD